jgi:hypothetical protein
MPINEVADSSLEEIALSTLSKAYILRNPALEKILFDRNLIGLDFSQACETATTLFLRHFEPELSSAIEEGFAELMLVSKGLYYWMHNAFAKVFSKNLEINFAATSRVEVLGNTAQVTVPYFNFDASANNLIIGDTLASGATITTALSLYLEYHKLNKLFLFTIAGSRVGGEVITRFCRERDIDLTIVYGLAAFGLAPNGFDLSFLHPDTITAEEYIARASEVFEGKPVSSVGWDFGTQAQAIQKYKMLCWLEAEYWGLQDSKVFQLKEPVTNARLVQKEYGAYKNRFPKIEEDS